VAMASLRGWRSVMTVQLRVEMDAALNARWSWDGSAGAIPVCAGSE
jgi:hypothetical protein